MTIKLLSLLIFVILACDHLAEAQHPNRVHRVGYLSPAASLNATASIEPFRQGLRALGYVEGQNIVIEWRFTKGDAAKFPGFAAELVHLKVDCIVTQGIPAIRSAKQATSTIPIVMNVGDDPVQMGLIANLARPESNITGFTNVTAELAGKRLELLKGSIPEDLPGWPPLERYDRLGPL